VITPFRVKHFQLALSARLVRVPWAIWVVRVLRVARVVRVVWVMQQLSPVRTHTNKVLHSHSCALEETSGIF